LPPQNEDLEKLVDTKQFRLDLYHRLRGLSVTIPPLRERIGDIDLLIDHFTKGMDIEFTEEVMKVLRNYSWPGNVRELESIIRTLCALKPKGKIMLSDIPFSFIKKKEDVPFSREQFYDELLEEVKTKGIKTVLEEVEKALLTKALKQSKDKLECADAIHLTPPTLSRRIKEFGLDNE